VLHNIEQRELRYRAGTESSETMFLSPDEPALEQSDTLALGI
jgi:hypothetical protein